MRVGACGADRFACAVRERVAKCKAFGALKRGWGWWVRWFAWECATEQRKAI